MRIILTAIAGILMILAYLPYILAILRGTTKPSKATWLIWMVLDSITLVGMTVTGTLNGHIIGAVIGVTIVTAFSFKYGTPGWSVIDKVCLVGAVIGIALWVLFNNPVLGIVASNVIVFIGGIPTFVNAWKHPDQEDRLAWTIFWLSCVFAVSAIPHLTLADTVQPINFFLIESIMMYILFIHGRKSRKER